MFTFINAAVIFAFGLVITGIVFLGVLQSREQAYRAARVAAFEAQQPKNLRRAA